MVAITNQQKKIIVTRWVNDCFVTTGIVAIFSTDDVLAATTAVDNALDTTLNAAVALAGGTATILQAINQAIPSPFSTATASQKALLVSYVLYARAGLI